MPNAARLTPESFSIRLSSSRSPATVRTRKPIHHTTATGMGLPASQSRLPTSHASPPPAITTVNSAGTMRTSVTSTAKTTALPRVIRSGGSGPGTPASASSAPAAVSAGPA